MNFYKEIKEKIKDNEIYERVKDYSKERHRVLTYFEIGRLLHEAGKHYGESIIQKYALSLKKEFGKKYDKRSLFRMRQFYLLFSESKWSSLLSFEQKVSSPLSPEQKVSTLNRQSLKTLYLKGNFNQKVSTLSKLPTKTLTYEDRASQSLLLTSNLS